LVPPSTNPKRLPQQKASGDEISEREMTTGQLVEATEATTQGHHLAEQALVVEAPVEAHKKGVESSCVEFCSDGAVWFFREDGKEGIRACLAGAG
jgi:hypothetical protein